eukprot:gene2740-5399_t
MSNGNNSLNLTSRCQSIEHLKTFHIVHNQGRKDVLESVIERINLKITSSKKEKKLVFLFLGGSISQMGYYSDFVSRLEKSTNTSITSISRGHGGTDVLYGLYCIDLRGVHPDIIFIDFRVNDAYVNELIMESFLRKVSTLNGNNVSNAPLIVLLNFAQQHHSCTNTATFLEYAKHYQLFLIELCEPILTCFKGKNWHLYSKDLVHPNGPKGFQFIADLLLIWWSQIYKTDSKENISLHNKTQLPLLPKRKYGNDKDEYNRFCECLNEHSPYKLEPIINNGFSVITRTRTELGHKSFRRMKRCWESKIIGTNITFEFYGSNLIIVIYQNRRYMGTADLYLDNEKSSKKSLSGYFEGYSWVNDANKTWGRQEAFEVYKNLNDTRHTITFAITNISANPLYPGHNFQIIALLYSTEKFPVKYKNVDMNPLVTKLHDKY